MDELSKLLTVDLKESLLSRGNPFTCQRVYKPETVAKRSVELACDAWSQREHIVREVAELGLSAWHAGQSPRQMRALYQKAARSYHDLLEVLDFKSPVEHLWSTTGQKAKDVEESFGLKFTRTKRDRHGQTYGVYLERICPCAYAAECALACAMIAQDWPLAESLARTIPIPMSTKARETMTLSMLRYVVLDRKAQVKKRNGVYSAYASGVDFPPRRPDFAIAIVDRDQTALSKALRATTQAFRRKWDMKRYMTPQWIKRHRSKEALMAACVTQLWGQRWAYSTWGLALMCLAEHRGVGIPTDERRYSDFLPFELCSENN